MESQNNVAEDPFVLWLNGGPGCSSELALFTENGPYTINDDLSLRSNPYSWNNRATVVYVDQPVGTGYSYSKALLVHSVQGSTDELYNFMQSLFEKYPQYSKLPLFLSGESYAGKYIPSLGAKILEKNQNLNDGEIYMDLRGIAVGNGYVEPRIQFKSYPLYAYQRGLIDAHAKNWALDFYDICRYFMDNNRLVDAYPYCNSVFGVVMENKSFNVYNIKQNCTVPPLCDNMTDLTDYLNSPKIKAQLGVPTHVKWTECDDMVYAYMQSDWVIGHSKHISSILRSGLPVLMYNGDIDLMCNNLGVEDYLSQMAWPGQDGFNEAEPQTWVVDGRDAGWSKTFEGLTYLSITDAGHMVPTDQPEAALDMINRFMDGLGF